MPGAEFVSEAVCQLEGLSVAEFAAFKYHAYVLAANKWKFIQLAPLFYNEFKAHRLFTDLPFFQNEEAVRCDLQPLLCIKQRMCIYMSDDWYVIGCRLFEGPWTQMVLQNFAEGKVVYRRLGYEGATRLLDTVADRIGSEWVGGSRGVPGNNAQKRQLMTALLQCIAEEENGRSAAASAVTLAAASGPALAAAPSPAPVQASSSPPTVAELPVSAMVSRKLVFDGASLDNWGVAALIQVYLDGYLGFSPFIKYFPVHPFDPSLPAQFRPDQEQPPPWDKRNSHRDVWDKRKDLAFEVCRQAYALQQAVNARVPVFEACRQEEHRQSKKKFVAREVSMDLRTAASKVAALLQAAMQTNKKNGCHPQTIATLSKMFKDLRAGKQDADVHRSSSSNKPNPRVPASSLQGWMCIASSSDIDTMLTDLYTQMRSTL